MVCEYLLGRENRTLPATLFGYSFLYQVHFNVSYQPGVLVVCKLRLHWLVLTFWKAH